MDRKPVKSPKKISQQYLENSALYYLQRFATSAENLRTVMTRKINRSCKFHNTDPAPFYRVLDDMITRYISSGLLDDKTFARAKTASMRRQGRSQRVIENKLQQKGLKPEDIQNAFADVDESEDAEFQAALKMAKRKKIGAFRTAPADIKEQQKEMAAMARAGFSFDIAKRALDYQLEDMPDDL